MKKANGDLRDSQSVGDHGAELRQEASVQTTGLQETLSLKKTRRMYSDCKNASAADNLMTICSKHVDRNYNTAFGLLLTRNTPLQRIYKFCVT